MKTHTLAYRIREMGGGVALKKKLWREGVGHRLYLNALPLSGNNFKDIKPSLSDPKFINN